MKKSRILSAALALAIALPLAIPPVSAAGTEAAPAESTN